MRYIKHAVFFIICFVAGGFCILNYINAPDFTPIYIVFAFLFWVPAAEFFLRGICVLTLFLLTRSLDPIFGRLVSRIVWPGPFYWITPANVTEFILLCGRAAICNFATLFLIALSDYTNGRFSWDSYFRYRLVWILIGLLVATLFIPARKLFLFFLSLGRRNSEGT